MEFWQRKCNTKLGLGLGRGLSTVEDEAEAEKHSINNAPVQLDLLPLRPVPLNSIAPPDSQRAIDVNQVPFYNHAVLSSPNSTLSMSMFHHDHYTYNTNTSKQDTLEVEADRASDEEEGIASTCRKKLRLSKDQSALLEESFRQHSTLNPKQKLDLAQRLNLSLRQVEVWFQNRRARTKLKQTEVDCEFLKRCCDTLTEENRKLKKELYELRALKVESPFYMQLPAATLSMCPSCERVVTTGSDHNINTPKSQLSLIPSNPSTRK